MHRSPSYHPSARAAQPQGGGSAGGSRAEVFLRSEIGLVLAYTTGLQYLRTYLGMVWYLCTRLFFRRVRGTKTPRLGTSIYRYVPETQECSCQRTLGQGIGKLSLLHCTGVRHVQHCSLAGLVARCDFLLVISPSKEGGGLIHRRRIGSTHTPSPAISFGWPLAVPGHSDAGVLSWLRDQPGLCTGYQCSA